MPTNKNWSEIEIVRIDIKSLILNHVIITYLRLGQF